MKIFKRVVGVAVALAMVLQPLGIAGVKQASAATEWMCKTCGQHFSSKVSSHTKVCGSYSYSYTNYTCATCGYTSSSQSSHTRSVSRDFANSVDHYSCSICGNVSSSNHTRTVSQNYSSVTGYRCSGCGGAFSSSGSHTRSCTGSFVQGAIFGGCSCGGNAYYYRCSVCGATYGRCPSCGKGATASHNSITCSGSMSPSYKCSRCGSSSSSCYHSTDVTCSGSTTKYYRCSQCGNVTTGSCMHSTTESCPASSWSSGSVYRCSGCGATRSSSGTHTVTCSGSLVPAVHTLSFNTTYNGGSGSIAAITDINDGTTLSGSHECWSKTATKSAWDFVGWNTNSSAKIGLNSLTMDDDKTLYAIYKKRISTTLKDYNGVEARSRTVEGTLWNRETQTTATLPELGEKTGWTAVGWKTTKEENSSGIVAPGAGTITDGLMLYGLYKKKASFGFDTNGDGEDDTTREVDVYHNSGEETSPDSNSGELVLPTETPEKTGYTFIGWQINDEEDLHSEGSAIEVTEGDKIKPVFVANNYTVTFHANDGSDRTKTQKFKYDEEQVLASNTFERKGYTFTGWNTSSTAEIKTVEDGKTVINLISKPDGNLDLYAVWSLNKYKIEFEKNDGAFPDGTEVTEEYSVEDSVELPKLLEREGYTFKGWWESEDFSGDSVATIEKGTIGDKKFYAKMTANAYRVEYNANGGEGSVEGHDAVYDSEVTTKQNDFSREHYHFVKWNTKADGSGKDFEAGQTLNWKIGEDITLYAQWEGDVYKVTLDPTTGTGGTAEFWERYDDGFYANEECTQALSEIEVPTMVGYEFKGYFVDGTKIVTEEGELTEECNNKFFGEDKTAEASWAAKHYQVTLNSGNATKKGDENVEAVYGEPLPKVEVPEWTRTVKFNPDGGEDVKELSENREFLGYYNGQEQYLDSVGNSTKKWDIDVETPGLLGKWKNTSVILPETTKVGHTFVGWSNGGKNPLTGDYELTKDDETLTALWSRNKYTVTYNFEKNGGTTCTCKTKKVLFNDEVDLTPEAIKPGWDFVGWNIDPDAKEGLEGLLIGAEDVTLYAIFGRAVKATFVDGTEEKVIRKNIYNGETSADLEVPGITEMDGWTSLGWTEEKGNDAEPQMQAGDALTVEQGTNRVFYARYSKPVTAVFNYDGGSTKRESVKECSSADLNSIKPGLVQAPTVDEVDCREGFTAMGWLKDFMDYSLDCSSGEELSLTEDAEYWLGSKKIISVEYKNCELPKEQIDVLWNTKTEKDPTLVLPSVSKEGYHSKGWVDSFGSDLAAGEMVTLASDEEFSAIWEPIKYKLSFDGNGASAGKMEEIELVYDEKAIIPKNQFKRKYAVALNPGEGKCDESRLISEGKFTGWKIGNDTLSDEQEVVNLTKENGEVLKLTAVWEGLTVKLPIPERQGYDFLGWKEADKTEILKGDFVPDRDYNLEAVWQIKSSNVTVDTQGSTNVPNFGIKAVWEKEMPELENKIMRQYEVTLDFDGMNETKKQIVAYEFVGIFSEKNGKGTQYYDQNGKPAGTWNQTGEQTVYVYWKPMALELPIPEYDGYLVDGWKYEGKVHAKEFIPEKDCTMTIVLTPKVFKLSLDANGGVLAKKVESYVYGEEMALPVPTRKNFTFLGWYDTDSIRVVNIDKKQTGDLTLLAKWLNFNNEDTMAGNKDIVDVEIPEGMEKIPDGFFEGCENLEKVTIPDSCKEIGNSAFKDCTNLKEVEIPGSVKRIGDSAFEGCEKLEKVTIGEGCKEIGDSAFKDCTSLKEVGIPGSVERIGDSAFEGCKNLEKVTIGEGCKGIGDYAFKDCTNLLDVEVPASVTRVGEDTFSGCTSLWRLSFENPMCEIYPSKDTIPENSAIYGYDPSTALEYAKEFGRNFVKIGTAYEVLAKGTQSQVKLLVAEGKLLPKTITIPTLVSDSSVVFDGYTLDKVSGRKKAGIVSNTKNHLSSVKKGSIVYDENVHRVGNLIVDCDATLTAKLRKITETKPKATKVTEATVGKVTYKVIKDGAYVKRGSKAAKSVTIAATVKIGKKTYRVTGISKNAFKDCKRLKKIVIKSTSLKSVGKNALVGTRVGLVVRVPKKSKARLKKLFTGKGNNSLKFKV